MPFPFATYLLNLLSPPKISTVGIIHGYGAMVPISEVWEDFNSR